MTAWDIFVQAVGVIGIILFFLSFQCRKNRRLFLIQALSYVFYTAHLFLLGAWTGGFSYLLNLARSLCLAGKSPRLKSRTMCVLLCVGQAVVMVLTWEGWLSLLPVLANIATTVGGYTKNPRKVRIAAIFINSPLWVIYDILIGSYAGIADEVMTELSAWISIARYGWKNMDHVEA